jgi:hypothetical protein
MDSAHSVTFYSVTQYLVTLVVKDSNGTNTLSPDTITLSISGGNQMATTSAWVDAGTNLQVASIMWQGVNVAPTSPASYVVSSPLTVTVDARVYDATIAVKDPLGLPIGGAECTITLANGTTIHTSTAGDGVVTLHMIPIGSYQGTVSAFGVTSQVSGDSAVQESVVIPLALSWAMIFVYVFVAVAVIIGAVLLFRRYRRPSYMYRR